MQETAIRKYVTSIDCVGALSLLNWTEFFLHDPKRSQFLHGVPPGRSF